ncbi:glycerol-3-phosphate dehydrogenase/oxidase [Paenibacillus sp. HB172176]|uniref:glycerol-3-phosphate dehydrogenase/oxidase n=1 Tax=Paenibacillus sp. HB172176 TaxID=2493690 RepID=UPI00143C3B74|nr:glycerol-3-phosphate dehydrogenase/oxidase [Paenibacillus sp. HB172176]
MEKDQALNRQDRLKRLEETMFDVLVIGGGITGAGIALDAATRGLKTALIEMQDFAAGTSSRSTKLVHGGLRYLKQFEVKMVAEVGKERAIVYENGPHVTTPEWMLLPFYQGGTFGAFTTSIGLRVYDFLAGVKREERRKMLSKEAALDKEPLLRREGMKGGGYYVEYRTDDARLTIEVMKQAVEAGAAVANYVKAEELLYEDGKLVGVIAGDCAVDGGTYRIKARKVVNATGPWVDTLREQDHSKKGKTLRLTKGVHLVFDGRRFPLRQAIYFDTPDKRMVFAIPRDGKTYVGTTDTDYDGDKAHPHISSEDRDYLLRAIDGLFPGLGLGPQDVESGWAGLRPLIYEEGKSPSEVSRKDEIFVSPSGMITIAGGKLTGYRRMAETVTDLLVRELVGAGVASEFGPCVTRTLPISGGDVAGGSKGFPAYVRSMTEEGMRLGLSEAAAERLARRYGSNAKAVFARVPDRQGRGYGLPAEAEAELLYSIEEEMTLKPVDFFVRRTGALFFDIAWVREWKESVIELMADKLGYSEEQVRQYTEELEREFGLAFAE